MSGKREFHSMCYKDENTMLVTGSRIPGFECMSEIYNVGQDSWRLVTPLPEGRCRHSSMGFADKTFYVFCGMINQKRTKSILSNDFRTDQD